MLFAYEKKKTSTIEIDIFQNPIEFDNASVKIERHSFHSPFFMWIKYVENLCIKIISRSTCIYDHTESIKLIKKNKQTVRQTEEIAYIYMLWSRSQ